LPLGEWGFFGIVAIILPKIQNRFGLWRIEVLKNVKVRLKYGTQMMQMLSATQIFAD
jgi:hypothetical protein